MTPDNFAMEIVFLSCLVSILHLATELLLPLSQLPLPVALPALLRLCQHLHVGLGLLAPFPLFPQLVLKRHGQVAKGIDQLQTGPECVCILERYGTIVASHRKSVTNLVELYAPPLVNGLLDTSRINQLESGIILFVIIRVLVHHSSELRVVLVCKNN